MHQGIVLNERSDSDDDDNQVDLGLERNDAGRFIIIRDRRLLQNDTLNETQNVKIIVQFDKINCPTELTKIVNNLQNLTSDIIK